MATSLIRFTALTYLSARSDLYRNVSLYSYWLAKLKVCGSLVVSVLNREVRGSNPGQDRNVVRDFCSIWFP